MINIAITGYYATGSSAMIDLLAEYDNVQVVPYGIKNYEHVPFYINGGLFNLCAILTRGNAPLVSDAAVNDFVDAMKHLNNNDFRWFGGYNKKFDGGFEDICREFVNSIGYEFSGRNVNHYVGYKANIKDVLFLLAAKFIKGRKISSWKNEIVFDEKPSFFAIPTSDEFYIAAKRFTDSYANLFQVGEEIKYRIFDHLVLPQQIDDYSNCFSDNFKFIVLERDPRDIYVSNKYMWGKKAKPFFPTNPDEFTEIWKRTVHSPNNSKNVLVVHFEDLIYNYNSEVKRIEDFLGLDSKRHTLPKKFFDNSVSIDNTQLFRADTLWGEDMLYLEEHLSEYLYSFPYVRIAKQEDILSYRYLKTDSTKK